MRSKDAASGNWFCCVCDVDIESFEQPKELPAFHFKQIFALFGVCPFKPTFAQANVVHTPAVHVKA